jgi:hypothetical protein
VALVAYNVLVLSSHAFRLFIWPDYQSELQIDHRLDPLRIAAINLSLLAVLIFLSWRMSHFKKRFD